MKKFTSVNVPRDAKKADDIVSAIHDVENLLDKTNYDDASECKFASLELRVLARVLANRAEDISGAEYKDIVSQHSQVPEKPAENEDDKQTTAA